MTREEALKAKEKVPNCLYIKGIWRRDFACPDCEKVYEYLGSGDVCPKCGDTISLKTFRYIMERDYLLWVIPYTKIIAIEFKGS